MESQQPEKLKREIGLRQFTLAIINNTVGAGIFAIPALLAFNMGASALVVYFVCGALIFLIALCFAEVGSKITVSGGTYAYIETAFGPFAGFIANNLFWFGACMISDAAVANALADTLVYFFHGLNQQLYRILFFVLIFGGLALINIRSVKYGARFIEAAAFAKLIPLILLTVMGIGYVSSGNLHWTSTPTIGTIGSASLVLIFAFLGVETPISSSGEIKNPKRTIPLAIFFAITGVLILYISIQLVSQGVLGATLGHQESPLGAVAGVVMGSKGTVIIIIAIAVSMLGLMAGEIMAVPRILYAGARDGIMPKALAKVHPRFFTPYISVAVYSTLGFLFAISGGFKQLVIIASASTLLIYLGVVLSTLKLRRKPSDSKTFRVPGGIIIPSLAACVIVWLLMQLTRNEVYSIGIFILICSVIYLFIKLKKARNKKQSLLGH